ncbi:hypothetical protein B0H14DRAFT_3137562 [Mycena olivaceomarginata]|nr:hypothetical protein B0H14DRAFT_3137562 [Mycena olivaceomarginata]
MVLHLTCGHHSVAGRCKCMHHDPQDTGNLVYKMDTTDSGAIYATCDLLDASYGHPSSPSEISRSIVHRAHTAIRLPAIPRMLYVSDASGTRLKGPNIQCANLRGGVHVARRTRACTRCTEVGELVGDRDRRKPQHQGKKKKLLHGSEACVSGVGPHDSYLEVLYELYDAPKISQVPPQLQLGALPLEDFWSRTLVTKTASTMRQTKKELSNVRSPTPDVLFCIVFGGLLHESTIRNSDKGAAFVSETSPVGLVGDRICVAGTCRAEIAVKKYSAQLVSFRQRNKRWTARSGTKDGPAILKTIGQGLTQTRHYTRKG